MIQTHRPAGIRNHCPIPAPGIKAVIDAGNNPGNQEFFRMVRAADPTGNRPVGIIIKCEALQPGDKDGVRIIKGLCKVGPTTHSGPQSCPEQYGTTPARVVRGAEQAYQRDTSRNRHRPAA